MSEIVSIEWVYEHLICEFSHWDICLCGLVERNGEKFLCHVCDEYAKKVKYKLQPVEWTEECQEFLDDYRVAYRHWCYVDGKRQDPQYGVRIDWYDEKWGDRDPIGRKAVPAT